MLKAKAPKNKNTCGPTIVFGMRLNHKEILPRASLKVRAVTLARSPGTKKLTTLAAQIRYEEKLYLVSVSNAKQLVPRAGLIVTAVTLARGQGSKK